MMRAHVIVPDDLIAEVDKVVGPRKRSEFFVEAVRENLRRDRLMAAADPAAGSLVGVDRPGWETSESAAEWVRQQRREADRRLNEMGWGTPASVAKDKDPDTA
jgi:metal-responsive CopG/Arc/MetJ family transcriptional regulator